MIFKKSVLGIDLGRRSYKGVKLKRERDEIHLDKYFFYDLIQRYEDNQTVIGPEEELKICLEVHNMKEDKASIAISNQSMSCLELKDFPKIPQREMVKAIAFELEQKHALDLTKNAFDYYLIEQDSQTTVKVLYTDKSVVEKYYQILKTLKLTPLTIDSEVLSISTALSYNGYFPNEDGGYIFVDLGEMHTTIALQIRGQVFDYQCYDLSLCTISSVLKTAKGLSYVEGEEIKKNMCCEVEDPAKQEAIQLCQEKYIEILNQIQLAVNEYLEWLGQAKLHAIYFVGGGVDLYDCLDLFREKYNTEVIVANPFRGINIHEQNQIQGEDIVLKRPHVFAVAIGLALRDLL
jgi:type IV pilus assembly protein PilM